MKKHGTKMRKKYTIKAPNFSSTFGASDKNNYTVLSTPIVKRNTLVLYSDACNKEGEN